MAETDQKNEGEGNRTAARKYDREATNFAKSGKVGHQAQRAKEGLEGAEREEMEKAEKAGRSHAKEEDPAVRRR